MARQSNAVRDMKGSTARRLLAAEEEKYAHSLSERERLMTLLEVERATVIALREKVEKQAHALDKAVDAYLDARAVPYLMDMIADLQGQVATLTGPDDPALDIDAPKDA